MLRSAAIVVFLSVVGAQPALAEHIPGFDMIECVGRAKVIARGKLERTGNITVTTMHRGTRPANGIIRLEGGVDRYNRFNVPPENSTLEVLIFLQDDGRGGLRPVRDNAGVVRFQKNDVYAFLDDARRGLRESPEVILHPDYKRGAFLAAFKLTLDRDDERLRLLARPRSAERTRDLMRFLVECPENARTFHFALISGGLAPVTDQDGRALLMALREATRPVEQETAMGMIGVLRVQNAFDDLPAFLDRKHAAEVRRAAMTAMTRLDPIRSAEPLGRLLSINEPEVISVLASLYSAGVDEGRPNRRVADGLLGLGRDLLQLHAAETGNRWQNESYNLLNLLTAYAHPQFISLLYEWIGTNHPTADYALATLQSLTGQKLRKDDAIGWRDWLRTHGPLLEARYELSADTGRKAWFKAYDKADEGARKLLVRIWLYESVIDESSLVQAAAKEHPSAAKAVLAELWQRGRLSGPSRKEIVNRFLEVKLVELPPVMKNDPAWRELQVVARPSFPFPERAWIQPRSSIEIGREPKLNDSWGSRSLADIDKGATGSMGGQYFGEPQARALVEIREMGRDGKVQWSNTWTLGPLKLRNAGK